MFSPPNSVRVTAGDGTPRSFPWARTLENHMELASPPVTDRDLRGGNNQEHTQTVASSVGVRATGTPRERLYSDANFHRRLDVFTAVECTGTARNRSVTHFTPYFPDTYGDTQRIRNPLMSHVRTIPEMYL
jgi:hypothetical protein